METAATNVANNGDGTLSFDYRWFSTSGNLADLSNCSVQEWVNYPTSGYYTWNSPLYETGFSSPSPTILPSPPIPGTDGTAGDNLLHPGFKTPYQADSFAAAQYFQYSCSNYRNGSWITFYGPLTITRTVQNVPPWTYSVSNNGSTASLVLP